MQAPATPFSVGECVESAWTTFKQNIGDYLVAQLVLALASFAASAALSAAGRGGMVLAMLLSSIQWTCSMSIAHAGVTKGKPKIEDAFRPLAERQGDYLMVCLAISVGILACGIGIVVTYFLCLFAPLLVFEGRDFKQAVIESKDLVLKYPAEVAIVVIVVAGLQIVGALACGVGILVSTPVACLTVVKAHERLSAKLALELPAQTPPPPAAY
ncbi:MAG TPA: hypothetical protein VJV78_12020 [Polyangiales bacterium]|nr:hypothetical protein [Polyangiales bacterium]